MKKFYIIAPLVLTIGFMFYYIDFSKRYEAEQVAVAIEQKQIEDAEIARKKENERMAKADADRRSAERAAEEARKDADRRAKWEEQGAEIARSTAQYDADAEKFSKQAADLEIQLLELRGRKEQASSEAFELAKRVELARIAKRNAELEIQRMTEMIARRAAQSSLTRVAATATPPAK